jgi:lipid A 3-O-deacylase
MKATMTLKTMTALAALLVALPCFAVDLSGASLEGGDGNRVGMLRVGVQSAWDARWLQSHGNHVSGYWDATLATWRGTAYRNLPGQTQHITSVGLAPVLRWQADDLSGWYAEAGIGANLLSELYDNNRRRLSTAFQFNDHLGVGYVFDKRWDVGLKLEHFSNGGIKEPNNGVNMVMVKVAYRFQ